MHGDGFTHWLRAIAPTLLVFVPALQLWQKVVGSAPPRYVFRGQAVHDWAPPVLLKYPSAQGAQIVEPRLLA